MRLRIHPAPGICTQQIPDATIEKLDTDREKEVVDAQNNFINSLSEQQKVYLLSLLKEVSKYFNFNYSQNE